MVVTNIESQNAQRIEALCDRAGLTTDEAFDLIADGQLRSVLLHVESDVQLITAQGWIVHERRNHALGLIDAAVLILPRHVNALTMIQAYVARI